MKYFLRSGAPVDPSAIVEVVSADRAKAKVWVSCHRCCGSGHFNHWAHIMGGVCFACGGSKGRNVIKPCYSEEKLAKLVAAADKRAEKKAAAEDAKRAANRKLARDLVGGEVWDAIADWSGDKDMDGSLSRNDRLILDIFWKAANYPISEKAADLLAKAWGNKLKWAAEKEARDAAAVDVEEGRYAVSGKVITVKEYSGHYGINYKMLVDCGNFRVFGSIPKALIREVGSPHDIAGKEVSFTGTFEPKEKGFGFFSRPSKAELVKEEV